ncbi:MAG: hypothetical protein ACI358_08350 [Candidatus Limimorpha sp.]
MTEEEKNKGLFVERKHVTLGVKLVVTFAMTYYLLYFLFLSYIVLTYNTVFDRSYFAENLSDTAVAYHYALFIAMWALILCIIVSLALVITKHRYGKFLFMSFTIIFIACQIFTTYPLAWMNYIIELSMALIIAPLKVVQKFNEKITEGKQTANQSKD